MMLSLVTIRTAEQFSRPHSGCTYGWILTSHTPLETSRRVEHDCGWFCQFWLRLHREIRERTEARSTRSWCCIWTPPRTCSASSSPPIGSKSVNFEDTCKGILEVAKVEIKRTILKGSGDSKDFKKKKKIFVGGIPTSVNEDEFKGFFSKFGKVVEHDIIRDHVTKRSRGFGFIVFDNEQVVDNILTDGNMYIKYPGYEPWTFEQKIDKGVFIHSC